MSSPARAEPPQCAPSIVITLVGTETELSELSSLVLEWYGDDRAQVEFRRTPRLEPGDVLDAKLPESTLRVWVVPSSPELVRVYLADGRGERFLVRDVSMQSGFDELGRESLAQVLATAGKAFLSHRASSTRAEVRESFEVGAPPDTPAALDPAAPRAPPLPLLNAARAPVAPVRHTPLPSAPERRAPGGDATVGLRALRAGVFYGASFRGPEGVGHGPGVLAGFSGAFDRVRLSATAKAQYQFSGEASGDTMTLHYRAHTLRLAGALETTVATEFAIGFEAGVGVDLVRFEPEQRENDRGVVAARGAVNEARGVALAAARGSGISGDLRFTLSLGLDVPLGSTRYVIETPSGARNELTAWPAHPTLAVEASWR